MIVMSGEPMKPLDIEAIKHSNCLTEEQGMAVMCDTIVFRREKMRD